MKKSHQPLPAVVLLLLLTSFNSQSNASSAKMITTEQLSLFGIHAGGRQTLKDVTKKLGDAKVLKSGDASESERSICYILSSNAKEIFIKFSTSEEMGSPSGQVNSITTEQIFKAERKKRCSKIVKHEPISLGQIGLGMHVSEIAAIYGTPTHITSQRVQYASCRKSYISNDDPLFKIWSRKPQCFENSERPYSDTCGNIEIKLKNNRAASIRASIVQSFC